jgi:cytochrome c553
MMKSVFAALVAATAISASAADAPAAAAPDAAKGASLFTSGDNSRGITACSGCHGDGGNATAPVTPKLASQHAAYVVKQLTNFKSGERVNPTMSAMAKNLTDDDIRNIAAYVSTQAIKPSSAKSKDTVELGKKIFRAGIKDKNVPACAACHGPTGAGIPNQFARIGGQNEDYTEAQLTAFAAGTRANNAIMATIASRMSAGEIKAVSDYVSGLR